MHTDEADPLERLRRIQAASQAEKQRQSHPAMIAQRSIASVVPAFVTKGIGVDARAQSSEHQVVAIGNTQVSNVPSKAAGAVFGDAPILATSGALAISDGDGIAHFVSSVDDVLTITVTVDSAMLRSIDGYLDYLRDELVALRDQSRNVLTGRLNQLD
ncbi:WS/DGAT domain-containing protein [Rhodococcus sp. NPDC054953]